MSHVVSASFRNVLLCTVTAFVIAACGGRQMSIEEFQAMAQEAEEQTASIAERQSEIRDILQAYNQTVRQARRLALTLDRDCGLCEEEQKALLAHIESEEDESCRALLLDILEIQSAIDELHEELSDLTADLPDPHRVAPGENHYTLSMDYLMNVHGLAREQADSLVARVALTGDIIEGFHVWFLYQEGVFGTFVTQGEAHISPTVFAKVVKNHLLEQARRQGREEAFESILDSLQRSGALLANIKSRLASH